MEHVEGKFTFAYRPSKIVTDSRCFVSKIDKLFTVHDDEVIKILTDMQLIDSEHMWDRILENNDVRNQIHAIIESVPPYLKISIAASGRTLSENVQEVKELLVDLNLFDSEHVWEIILKSDYVKNQIYAMLESVGHFQ